MLHCNCYDAFNRFLLDLKDSPEPFGKIIIFLGGDFMQTLPIIPKGLKDDIIDSISFTQMFADI